jgi:tryptophan synthase alpha chain
VNRDAHPSPLTRAIALARAAGRPALAAYVTAGFPSPAAFPGLVERVASAADIVEVGIPFSDPMADGVTIQRSSRRALEQGTTLAGTLEVLRDLRLRAPAVVMSYLNPLLAYGLDRLPAALESARVAGVIVPDLPLEEGAELGVALGRHGIDLIQLVAPATADARLARLCAASRGFVYAVAVNGITGGAADAGGPLTAHLDRVRGAAPVPVLAGFGIRDAAQVRRIAPHADGVIVGSALIERLERDEDPVPFLLSLVGRTPENA